jgi:hypothetical protein
VEDATTSIHPKLYTAIKSMRYVRHIKSDVTNTVRGVDRQITVDSNMLVNGMHNGTLGVLVTGTRTENVLVNKGSQTGTWIITHTYKNLAVTRDEIEGGYSVNFNGTVNIHMVGDVSDSTKGTSKHIDQTITLTLNGTKNVTITVDHSNGTTTVNITTGELN